MSTYFLLLLSFISFYGAFVGSGHKVQVKSASTKVTAVSTKSIASLSSYPSESSKGVPHELTVVKNILIVDGMYMIIHLCM